MINYHILETSHFIWYFLFYIEEKTDVDKLVEIKKYVCISTLF